MARGKICPLSGEGCEDGRCKIGGPCAHEIDAKARAAAEKANPRPFVPRRQPTGPRVLVRVVAPDFVAGLIMQGDQCVHATADHLKWAVDKNRDWLRAEFANKGWKASIVPDYATRRKRMAKLA